MAQPSQPVSRPLLGPFPVTASGAPSAASSPYRAGADARVDDGGGILLGSSAGFRKVQREAAIAAQVDSTVVLVGESGVGKDLVARLIHRWSARANRPFLTLCCAELPENLLHSELFGHEAGAFTGASGLKLGRFERTHGGTLFLDEVGELSAGVQLALLRVLETRYFERVGGGETLRADFRLICATHQDLEELVRMGRFRQDLYYRLQVLRIPIPPLQERREDILPLAEFFLQRNGQRMEKRLAGFSQEAARALLTWSWPGNVRELSNVIERAAAFADGALIQAADLPEFRDPSTAPARPLRGDWEEAQRSILRQALERHGGNRHAVARELGIDRGTLYGKLKRWDLEQVGRAGPGVEPETPLG